MIKEVIILLILLMPSAIAEDIQNSPRNINIEDTSSRLLEENYYSILESNIVAKFNNDVEYLHRDRLGSNIATTGNDLKRNKNLPFGQEISNDGITYSFTGKELDDNDLYYFVNRYYNPDSGRFLETDSVYSNPSYVYANNNPLLYVDPDGRNFGKYFGSVGSSFEPSSGVSNYGDYDFTGDVNDYLNYFGLNDLIGDTSPNLIDFFTGQGVSKGVDYLGLNTPLAIGAAKTELYGYEYNNKMVFLTRGALESILLSLEKGEGSFNDYSILAGGYTIVEDVFGEQMEVNYKTSSKVSNLYIPSRGLDDKSVLGAINKILERDFRSKYLKELKNNPAQLQLHNDLISIGIPEESLIPYPTPPIPAVRSHLKFKETRFVGLIDDDGYIHVKGLHKNDQKPYTDTYIIGHVPTQNLGN